jgi:hypothetical protein
MTLHETLQDPTQVGIRDPTFRLHTPLFMQVGHVSGDRCWIDIVCFEVVHPFFLSSYLPYTFS